jgi:hypothetical protein
VQQFMHLYILVVELLVANGICLSICSRELLQKGQRELKDWLIIGIV